MNEKKRWTPQRVGFWLFLAGIGGAMAGTSINWTINLRWVPKLDATDPVILAFAGLVSLIGLVLVMSPSPKDHDRPAR